MLQTDSHVSLSFDRVYRANHEYVWRTLRALGVNASAVDDATQDVFVVVHRRLGEFEGRASIKTWLYEIARRVALRYRGRALSDAGRTFELPELRASDDLDAAVDRAMAAEILRSFIDGLDEDRRRTFVLAELWEMRGREIADALDANINTVYARLRSARVELDRIARRLEAKNAGALTRAMRSSRPTARARQRTYAGVLATVGAPGGLAAATTAATPLAAGVVKWVAIAGVAGAVLATTVVAISPNSESAPSSPAARSEIHASTAVMPAASQPVHEPPRPVAPAAPTAPAETQTPTAQPSATRGGGAGAKATASDPTLTEQLEQVRAIRSAVRAEEAAAARTAIEAYRARFPTGAFRLEVDALAVELSCRIASPDAGDQLGAFERRRPDSQLLSRLKKICTDELGPQKTAAARTHDR